MSYQASMAFTMIVSWFEKSHCLRKSLAPSPRWPNLIKTLPIGTISKLMIQSREPIPTYILLNLLAYYGHGISNMVYMLRTFHFPY